IPGIPFSFQTEWYFCLEIVMSEKRTDLVKAIKEKGKNIEAEMSFFDHLDVLRGHLIRASLAIVAFTILAFTFYDFIFDKIIMGPGRVNFWTYRMMCAA